MRSALTAVLLGLLQGCVISASNFIRNESDAELPADGPALRAVPPLNTALDLIH
jgi:hypothetical protein